MLRKARCEHGAMSVGCGIAVGNIKHANVVPPPVHMLASHTKSAQGEPSKKRVDVELVMGAAETYWCR